MKNRDYFYTSIVPHPRQLAFQQMEFYGFIHFTVNTFTDKEWGDGSESPAIFNPTELDAGQWAGTAKAAGMTGLILTCKHHDGFCLWPSKYTNHSVAASPYRDGKGDIVEEVSEACRQAGLKFGIYLSPWDRNNAAYGSGKDYDDYYLNQLTELLTGYGDIFSVWLDGACGEGLNGKVQTYDWERYYACIRQLQPDACISVCGPDIRWCGNESGHTKPSEWSVVPARLALAERVQEKSQKADDTLFRERRISSSDLDLGSRKVLTAENDLIWYPAEVNTSIRPGWFYHPAEDNQQKDVDELIDIYIRVVGGNGMFLLNLPPMPNGKLHHRDVEILNRFGNFLRRAFARNLLTETMKITADPEGEGEGIQTVLVDNYTTWYQPSEGITEAQIEIMFATPQECRYLVLKENIQLGQRIESFTVELFSQNHQVERHTGTVVGYKKIIPLTVKADRIVISINDARVCPTLAFIGIY